MIHPASKSPHMNLPFHPYSTASGLDGLGHNQGEAEHLEKELVLEVQAQVLFPAGEKYSYCAAVESIQPYSHRDRGYPFFVKASRKVIYCVCFFSDASLPG